MQTFTGKEYLKIDIANSFGLDKKNWDERIQWFDDNEHQLHSLVQQAEEPALFYAGILAWEKAQKGEPCGYPISLDATCSGIQILAAMCCDRSAAKLCNVIDTGKREDAYTTLYQKMVNKIGDTAKIERAQTKDAIMTAFYGSTAQPKEIFGTGKLLDIFYETMKEEAPGAWEINETMLAIWDKTVLEHSWVLPDNFHVHIKVMNKVSTNVHFLNQPYVVTSYENMPIEGGRSLGANLVHSVDGMIVREMIRRCDYDARKIARLKSLAERKAGGRSRTRMQDKMVMTLLDHYKDFQFLSARILKYLDIENAALVPPDVLLKLINSMPAKPFQVIAIHDCFRCLPNHGNDLRQQYNNLLSEIAFSEILSVLVSQIVMKPVKANKMDPYLGHQILNADYALS